MDIQQRWEKGHNKSSEIQKKKLLTLQISKLDTMQIMTLLLQQVYVKFSQVLSQVYVYWIPRTYRSFEGHHCPSLSLCPKNEPFKKNYDHETPRKCRRRYTTWTNPKCSTTTCFGKAESGSHHAHLPWLVVLREKGLMPRESTGIRMGCGVEWLERTVITPSGSLCQWWAYCRKNNSTMDSQNTSVGEAIVKEFKSIKRHVVANESATVMEEPLDTCFASGSTILKRTLH